MLGLVAGLSIAIRGLNLGNTPTSKTGRLWKPRLTYSFPTSRRAQQALVGRSFSIRMGPPRVVWDVGCNTGVSAPDGKRARGRKRSRSTPEPGCVEALYRGTRAEAVEDPNILPLVAGTMTEPQPRPRLAEARRRLSFARTAARPDRCAGNWRLCNPPGLAPTCRGTHIARRCSAEIV